MSYSSQIFAFFIAVIVYIYAVVPPRFRSAVLSVASFMWYWTWGPVWCVSLFSLTAANYFVIRLGKKFISWLVFADILIFLSLKGLPFFNLEIQGPFGISFYFLSLLGFLIDRKRSASPEVPRFFDFLAVPAFFPALLSGPVLRSRHYTQFSALPEISVPRLVDGGLVFFFGFFKQQILGKPLLFLTTKLFAENAMSSPGFWAAGLAATLTAYIEFSGFCDMGRGAAKCFGIDLDVNFRAFYYAKNPVDFWARWNISLGEWIRDYLSFPLMLTWGKRAGQAAVVILSFVVVGLWHGLTPNWLLFGFFNGFLVWLYYRNQQRILFGRVLAWILFVGNGILTQRDLFILILGKAKRVTPPAEPDWRLLCAAVFLLVIAEFFQEQKRDADFYIRWPARPKLILFSALTAIFLWQIAMFNSGGKFLPPVYFRF